MTTSKVLEQLQKHGQLLDSDIARATHLPLADVQASIIELSARGEISQCSVTRFVKGKAVEQLQCRISGYIPRPAPGRKPAAK
ncbi:MAG: transcriptional regulator [Rhodocyclales bacterium]|nr:transcriptional regulator [Rhodocyclales bacterium]